MILTSLIENLEAQLEWHQLLLDVLEVQAGFTARTALLDLEDIVGQRDLITNQIASLEAGRLKMVQAFVQKNNMEPDSSLEMIAAEANPEQGARLRQLKAQLLALVTPIRQFALLGAEKAQARSNCYSEVHQSLHRSFKRTSTYSQYGQVSTPKGSVFLTRSV